ncbi:hypothetical protein ABD83_13600 [Bacillus xiamenensis]|nr:hypothetical protein [Bacillus xiamenensis]
MFECTSLALFQKFIVYMIFAWRVKETGYRRLTKAYISMSRKGGKSVLVAGSPLLTQIKSQLLNQQKQHHPSLLKSRLPTGILKVTKPLKKEAGVKAIQEALTAVYFLIKS